MEITIYTIPNCPYCLELKTLLDNDKINYKQIDVSLEENETVFLELSKISNSESVPMVTIDKHLLVPEVNFFTINQCLELIKHITSQQNI